MDATLMGLLAPKAPVQGMEMGYKSNKFKDTQEKGKQENFQDIIEKRQSKTDEVFKDKKDTTIKKESNYKKVQRAQSVVNNETEVSEKQPLTVKGMEELIMQLLMEQLNLSEEQIKQVLNTQGITLTDLSDQQVFRNFIMEALGQDEMSFLNGQEDIKAISTLWEQVKAIKSVHYSENQIVTEEAFISEGEVVKNTVTTIEMPTHNEVIEEGVLIPKDLKEVLQKSMGNEMLNSSQTTDSQVNIGLTLPVQGVFKEAGLRFWQTNPMQSNAMMEQKMDNSVHVQMIEKIHYAKLQAGKELEMQLTPKELGKLTLKMVEQNGVLTAQIKVEQDKTKTLIMENLQALKEGLEKQGLVIQDVQVEVKKDSHQTQMEMGKQKSTKRIQDIIAKHMSDVLEEEQEQQLTEPKSSLTSIELDYQV